MYARTETPSLDELNAAMLKQTRVDMAALRQATARLARAIVMTEKSSDTLHAMGERCWLDRLGERNG